MSSYTTEHEAEARYQVCRDALQDIAFGADMMLQIPSGGAFEKYIREVRRVATEALKQVKP